MACVRCYLCVMLILLSFAQSETRPLDPSLVRRNLIRTIRALGETEPYNVKLEDEGMIGGQLSSKRVSPGGPDAHHH
ncbi:CLAVATA3/ESR (CLE)-RELATED PROTEIN 3 [Salix purpurea]|uniref:CLAVATA3/ESR (CLE)-RELATED PROTEIN 3 n=1 Tax=Salix purpurea TaxID=77065 RepID=A0A9Q1AG52_SALPP|nr:CLAVATA3/ESR (CLE)-RELATED PROTEIN 3 [Salix purpurea]